MKQVALFFVLGELFFDVFLFPAEAKMLRVKSKRYLAVSSKELVEKISESEKDRLLRERADTVCSGELKSPDWSSTGWTLSKTKEAISVDGKVNEPSRKNLFATKSHLIFSEVFCELKPPLEVVRPICNLLTDPKSSIVMNPETELCGKDLRNLNPIVQSPTIQSPSVQKVSKGLVKTRVDLSWYPEEINHYDKNEEITFGDLHGNTLKLIYFLIREGILELGKTQLESKKLYAELKEIYLRGGFLVSRQPDMDGIRRFNEILNQAKIKKDGPKLRFIGDEMADRGLNDYFTLQVVSKLDQSKVPFEILLSNHGAEFLFYYEQEVLGQSNFNSFLNLPDPQSGAPANFFGRSLGNLQSLIRQKNADPEFQKTFRETIQNHYLPRVKVLSYSLNQGNQMSLYTHAPVGLEAIAGIAKRLAIQDACLDIKKSSQHLARCVDEINRRFENSKNSREVSILFKADAPSLPLPQIPFKYLYENRKRDGHPVDRPKKLEDGVPLSFIHGHDGIYSYSKENVVGLDDMLGRQSIVESGEYSIFHSVSKDPG